MSNYPDSESNNYSQCHDEMLWWDNEDVNNRTFLNSQFDLYSSCEESETMSECFVNSPNSMERIAMVSTPMESALVTAISQEMVDAPFSTPSSESEEEEEELSVADRVRNRHRRCVPHPVDVPDPVIVSVSPSVRTSTAGSSSDEEEINNNNTTSGANTSFINNMLLCMNQVAPDAQFDSMKSKKMKKKKAKRRKKKMLHPDLISMWHHASQLFTEATVPVAKVTPSPYPKVKDWAKVNQRNLANLPKPQHYPVQGCAEDPSFFEKRKSPGGTLIRSLYEDRMVGHSNLRHGSVLYGSLPGFLTEAGIISPGSHGEVVSGYVWSEVYEDWVLQATNPQQQEQKAARSAFRDYKAVKKKSKLR